MIHKTLVAVFASAILSVSAATIDVDGITYNIYSQNEAKLSVAPSSGNPYSGEIVIPASVARDGKVWSVIQVDRGAFAQCPELTKVSLPESVKTLMDYVFTDTPQLQTVEMPGVTMIYDMAFYNSGIRQITLPESLARMRNAVFFGCKNLTKVRIPASLTYLGGNAPFMRCTSLTEIEVDPENPNFKSADGALYSKDGKKLVDYPAGREQVVIQPGTYTLGEGAFKGADKIVSVTLPASVHEIERYVFDDCDALIQILTEGGNFTFQSYEGILYSGATLAICPRGLRSAVVRAGTTELADRAFNYCTQLREVQLPESLTRVGDQAFGECHALKNIVLPQSVCALGTMAFYRCAALESIVVPDRVEVIKSGTFSFCESMNAITLGENVKSIKTITFEGCDNINTFNVKAPVPPEVSQSHSTFVPQDVLYTATLNVPVGSADAYTSVSPWNQFANMQQVDFAGVEDVTPRDTEGKNAPCFDLHGRRIHNPAKNSPYIQNGLIHIKK